ncbi:putative F-box protein At3g10430 [Rhododendron vialii]|uniref:putative F-box protein At3g10430 n=1 Tax=Rhododendron vialii TaxID=182163 RepID=UPI00265E1CC3|nr:putative F-box protein At3g10430 [Rhododendron vialii]
MLRAFIYFFVCKEEEEDQSFARRRSRTRTRTRRRRRFHCWSFLPEELLFEILSRLPVKSLMQLKCVCKTWRAIPTNPSFIASHLEKDAPTRLVIWNANHNGLLVGHDGFHTFVKCSRYDFQPVNLTFGFHRKADLILGSCDDVWSIGKDGIYGSTKEVPTIALWNLATRAFSILPMSICDLPPYGQLHRCLVGFGLDLKTKSYKVVKFSYFGDDDFGVYNNSVEVYDFSSGPWRVLHADHFSPKVLIHDGPQINTYNKNDGVFHWFALHNYDLRSVSCYEGQVLS